MVNQNKKEILKEIERLSKVVKEYEETHPEEVSDETVGEVSEDKAEDKSTAEGFVVENTGAGISCYRDYKKMSNSKLKRLIR